MIQSQDFSTSSDDASASCSGKSESCNAELGYGQEAVVIRDSANYNDRLVVRLLRRVCYDSRDGDGRPIDARHEESAQNDFIERGLGSAWECALEMAVVPSRKNIHTGKEAIQLHEKLEIDIVTLGCLAVSAPNVMSVEIDTYSEHLIVSL